MNHSLRGCYLWSPVTVATARREQSLAERFFEARAHKVASPNTRRAYDRHFRALQAAHPDKRCNELAYDDLAAYIRTFVARGCKEETILSARTALRSIFSWAAAAGYLPIDISLRLTEDFDITAKSHRRHVWLSVPQIRRVLATCVGDDPASLRDRVLLQVALSTGLRSFELAALRWADLDLDAGQVIVRKGKGDKLRTVPIPADLTPLLEKWRRRVEEATGYDADTPDVHGRLPAVFPRLHRGNPVGWQHQSCGTDEIRTLWHSPLSTKSIGNIVERRGTEGGVPELRPHDLRRTYAGTLENAGVPVQTISKLLGHSTLDTTTRYLSDNPAKTAEAIKGVDFGL